jgi:hypothetical protein
MPTPSDKTPKREPISATLPPDIYEQLMAETDQRMISHSILIEKALRAFLPTLPPLPSDDNAPTPAPASAEGKKF